jgi:glyoxylase-like metal-dependent hydrolase (beta-lactamase superfamily II)
LTNAAALAPVANRIWRVVNEIFPSNSYVCAIEEPGGCFLVDPGTDPGPIEALLEALQLKPRQVFCTHGHFDHAGSAAYFQAKHGIPCYLHEGDLRTLRGSNFLLMAFRIPFSMEQPKVTEARTFPSDLATLDLQVIPSPGHTPGSCLLRYGKVFFTGDTLYSRGVGLSRLPGEDSAQLRTTLLALWEDLPLDGLVLPGHGDAALFGTIREENGPLRAFLGLSGTSDAEVQPCL